MMIRESQYTIKSYHSEKTRSSTNLDSVHLSKCTVNFQESSKNIVPEHTTTEKRFEKLLQWARLRFECSFNLIINEEFERGCHGVVTGNSTRNRVLTATPRNIISEAAETRKSKSVLTIAVVKNVDTVVLQTLHDKCNRVVEIVFAKQSVVPRQLLQIIGLVGKRFHHLRKITLKCCCLNKYTIHEIVKILDLTTITELSFDGSVLSEGNYGMLLEKPTNLKILSLARCKINDILCKQIFEQLNYFGKASKCLLVLDLSMNFITDEGAKYAAYALRTNRYLRHLNLAGNQISDKGAINIFEVLMLFPLTYEECIATRKRYPNDLRNQEQTVSDESTSFNSSKSSMPDKACLEPFSVKSTLLRNGYRHCHGNMVLSSLNLSYNNLGYPSLKKLEAVIRYQSTQRQIGRAGLIRPLIEGNNLPVNVTEYKVIASTLENFAINNITNQRKRHRRKSTKTTGFEF